MAQHDLGLDRGACLIKNTNLASAVRPCPATKQAAVVSHMTSSC